jgi:hypothetical protein
MPAPNLQTLLDIETEVETVLYNYLFTTLALPATATDTNATQVTPRLEVICELLDEGMNQQTIPSGSLAGTVLYTQKNCRVTLNLTYSPARPQSPNVLRGTLRQVTANYPAIKAAFAVNSYYLLAPDTLRQVGGGRTVDSMEKTETLRTVLQPVFFINPSGFPA